MLFENITLVDENNNVKKNQYLSVIDERIDYIGSEKPQGNYDETYNGKDKLIIPGFYNSHGHSPMTLLRGYGENMVLSEWLNKRIFPFESKLTGTSAYYGSMLSIAESLRYGIVSTTDMYFFTDEIAKAVSLSGAKMNIGRALAGTPDGSINDMDSFKEAKELFNNFHNAENGRIKIDMSLHAEYTSNENLVRQLAEYTSEINTGMHVHISETQSEHEECKARNNGKTPTEYLNDLGLFNTRTTAAHCVWVTEKDMDILKEKNVTVASCPVSNLKLASGICNVEKLLNKGINVAIGTDSVASNNSLNFIEEMKFFSLLKKETEMNPRTITPIETLNAGTVAGAKGQGREDSGMLKEGYKADLVVMDISGPHMYPVYDMITNLVYSSSGSDVVLTMVDGKVLYKNGEFTTIDIEKTKYEVNKEVKRILGEL